MTKQVAAEITLASAVAAGGTFSVPYPSGYVQADFTGANASTSVMGADHDDLPVTLGGSAATVTWPAGKGTTLPAGTDLTIGLELVGTVERADLQGVIANQADSEAADVAGVVVDLNLLLDKLKASGLMVAD